MKERLVFDYAMEAILRVLGEPVPPQYHPELVALGVDPTQPLRPAYPVEQYGRVAQFIAQRLSPHLPSDAASFELGRAFLRSYRKTPMGKGVYSVTQFIGPHRALERMERNFRSANNYTQTRLLKLAPTHYELWFNHAPNVHYMRGVLTEAMEGTGAQHLAVTLLSREPGGEATFRVVWREEAPGTV